MDPAVIIEAAKAADTLGSAGLVLATTILVSACWSVALMWVFKWAKERNDKVDAIHSEWRESDDEKEVLFQKIEVAMREENLARSTRAQSWMAISNFVESANRAMTTIDVRLQQIEARLTQIEARKR